MKRKPIHTVRSLWSEVVAPLPPELGAVMFLRNCHDGTLTVIVADEPGIGWHMSISHRGHKIENSRYPTWDEIADARDVFLPADTGFVMHLPKADEYVAVHPTTFHLHEDREPALRRWKDEATEVLNAWEAVWSAAGEPGPLGARKSDAVLARIRDLESEVADLVRTLSLPGLFGGPG